MKKVIFFSIIFILLDQLIKIFIDQNMLLNSSINIINGFFSITYVRNYGAAFSMFNGSRIPLILVSIGAIIFIYFILINKSKMNKLNSLLYGLLYGGITGNLIDRLIHGYVIDYLDFNIFGYDFPIFNFADICIVISIILISVFSLRGNNNG